MTLAHIDTPNPSLIAGVEIDREAVLRSLNINVRDPKHQAMLLICDRYDLDPVLKHAVIISGNAYITRDGLLHVAHQSGLLNGIVIEAQGENDDEWTARVTVYVRGQDHGYSYPGRYSKKGQQKAYGPEMAIKCAEVHALRRAFGVTGLPVVEEQWDKADAIATTVKMVEPGPELATPEQVARIDVLLPQVPEHAMPALKAWKTEQGISMKAGEFTAEHADMVVARLEGLAEVSGGGESVPPPADTPGVRTGGEGEDRTPSAPNPQVEPTRADAPPAAKASPPSGVSPEPGGEADDPSPEHGEQSAPLSGPDTLKATNETAYKSLNRYCRKVAADHFADDKPTKDAQWEALAYQVSAGRTTHLGELTPDEASDFRRRCQDVANGLARWVESDVRAHRGWTFDLSASELEAGVA